MSEHHYIGPTSEQIQAMRRIEVALANIHETNQKINAAILEHQLEQFGIVRLHSTPQSLTMGSIAEAIRKHQGAFLLERKAA